MNTKVSIENLSINFLSRATDDNNIRAQLLGLLNKKKKVSSSHSNKVLALDNISLELNEGDRLGLIGSNGSGKSTLLRVIARILHPAHGKITIKGKVNSIFDPSLGMDPEASGIENIRIRCMILGVPRKKIAQKTMEITEFSGLGEAVHRPIKTYSSGMAMKLAFSIATSIEPEILVMDEWLSAGDARFVSKALKKMEDLINISRILVLASHSEKILEEWCNRLVWLQDGKIIEDGKPATVLKKYKEFSG